MRKEPKPSILTFNCLINIITASSKKYLKKYNIHDYVNNREDGIDKEILQCFTLIYMDYKKIFQDAINNGDDGRYQNEEKLFFEWMAAKLD